MDHRLLRFLVHCMTLFVRAVFLELQSIFMDFFILSRKIINPFTGCTFEFDESVLRHTIDVSE